MKVGPASERQVTFVRKGTSQCYCSCDRCDSPFVPRNKPQSERYRAFQIYKPSVKPERRPYLANYQVWRSRELKQPFPFTSLLDQPNWSSAVLVVGINSTTQQHHVATRVGIFSMCDGVIYTYACGCTWAPQPCPVLCAKAAKTGRLCWTPLGKTEREIRKGEGDCKKCQAKNETSSGESSPAQAE